MNRVHAQCPKIDSGTVLSQTGSKTGRVHQVHSPQPSSTPKPRAQRPCNGPRVPLPRFHQRARLRARLSCRNALLLLRLAVSQRPAPCRRPSSRAPHALVPTPQRLPARPARQASLPNAVSWPDWPCRGPMSRHSPTALLPQSRYKILYHDILPSSLHITIQFILQHNFPHSVTASITIQKLYCNTISTAFSPSLLSLAIQSQPCNTKYLFFFIIFFFICYSH